MGYPRASWPAGKRLWTSTYNRNFLGPMLNKTFFRLVKNPPEEFKEFLIKKQADNKQLLEFFIAEPDEQTRKAHYAQGQQLWNSVGNALRGFITEALTKNNQSPYVGGNEPSETDCEFLGYTKGFSRC